MLTPESLLVIWFSRISLVQLASHVRERGPRATRQDLSPSLES